MDVRAERVIPLPPDRVAEYAMDWRHDHEWTQGIKQAELTTAAPNGGFGVGAEVTRTAHFLGRRIHYVLRVRSYDPPSLLDLKSVAGPFPMHVTYRFNAHPDGTLASIQIQGGTGGYYRLTGPVMGLLVRANIRKDLRDLARKLS